MSGKLRNDKMRTDKGATKGRSKAEVKRKSNTSQEIGSSTLLIRLFDIFLALLIPGLILLHLVVSPYTKVEESFTIQATHDILQFGVPWTNTTEVLTSQYDHVSFPGSVPRTFVGPLLLAGVTSPVQSLVRDPAHMQLLVRATLGVFNAAALQYLQRGVSSVFGRPTGRWFTLFTACQFHVLYYSSRTLTNTFALALTNIALCNLMLVKHETRRGNDFTNARARLALYLMTLAGIIFRSEVALMLAMETLCVLYMRRAGLLSDVIPAGILGLVVGLLATVSVDSFFWQQFPLWPEWVAFYYNAILGRSSDWGTSPFHYYFTNALPKTLINPIIYILSISSLTHSERWLERSIVLPQLAFVTVYSLLPHKEWRFVLYTVPALTKVAASRASWIYTRRAKTWLYRLSSCVLLISTATSFLVSLVLLYVSSLNYPGGEALAALHRLHPEGVSLTKINVYLDNLACQTGVTRFQQVRSSWHYDKTEDEEALLRPDFWQQFDYVLAEKPELVIGRWQTVASIPAFAGVTVRPAEGDVTLPIPAVFGDAGRRIQDAYESFALFTRQRLTRGYWPAIRMVPKVHILKKQRASNGSDRPSSQT